MEVNKRSPDIVMEDYLNSEFPSQLTSQELKLTKLSFSFAHTQFVWDCKSEPSVRDIFSKIWGTERLTISFGTELVYGGRF